MEILWWQLILRYSSIEYEGMVSLAHGPDRVNGYHQESLHHQSLVIRPHMPRFRIAVATAPFRLPLKESISTVARMGAQGVQFDLCREVTPHDFGGTALKQLMHYVEERNLKVATATFTLNQPLYEFDSIDTRVHAITQAMELASRMNIRQLTLRVGRIPDEPESKEYTRMVDILRDLAQLGNHLGVVPCITPSEDASQSLIQVCQTIREGVIAIDFDPAGVVMTRRDPVQMLGELHEYAQHLQFRDGRRDVDGVGVEVSLGRGQVKWEEILALLDEIRFTFWCTVRRTTGDDRIGDCQRAIQYIQHVSQGM